MPLFIPVFYTAILYLSRGEFGRPYDSNQGMPPVYALVGAGILGYIVLRVWWVIYKEKKGKK